MEKLKSILHDKEQSDAVVRLAIIKYLPTMTDMIDHLEQRLAKNEQLARRVAELEAQAAGKNASDGSLMR